MSLIRVAVVGAGPVGLTLSHLSLKLPSIQVVVFETDKPPHAREQGGILDLHSEPVIICDKKIIPYIDESRTKQASSGGCPETDRRSLREMLLESHPKKQFDGAITCGQLMNTLI
ncbi:hypothetical protein N7457_008729 [Penicillium paradoxum]|uniref:uncharacterized protein n=1 Tax=Penicillium paradoxum TaxID=176176 RepID=UPI0025483268|nr:uncharacterized protein N7457_008729 [Penicillium paradoxum]KAJ5773833.1 hypothetical protein N7457_008729 [Penicillium paradoxum]